MGLRKYTIFLLLLLVFLPEISCRKNEKSIEKAFLSAAFNNIKINENIEWIIILPGLGCIGCIQEGEAFMKKNINNDDILFILTSISSVKILEQKLEIKLENVSNVLVDRKNEFVIPTINRMYPCIIDLKGVKIVSLEFQSPQNGLAFSTLRQHIKSE